MISLDLAKQSGRGKKIKKALFFNYWKKNSFEDGFPNIMLDVSNLPGRSAVFFADLYNPANMFSQLSVVYALPRYLCRSLTVVLPYFPTGTMERVDTEGQIATAHTLAKILSTIPISTEGPAKIIIYDIHTLQNRFYFGDKVIPYLASAVPDFIEKIRQDHSNEEVDQLYFYLSSIILTTTFHQPPITNR
eukprot:TRINITY_DN5544_c0_g1_i14.p1 TRINITY_DN5544_c0_g1~~TRINITY_DN5544_c0_g1_i14.p1  ORF type:complete len:190 (-),score=14.93 TRINITY_DN5544_c0_g1_i14:574-1143(-)